MAYYKKNNK